MREYTWIIRNLRHQRDKLKRELFASTDPETDTTIENEIARVEDAMQRMGVPPWSRES